MAETAHHNFRLGAETLKQIDAIKERSGLSSRAEVIRMAVRWMFVETTKPRKKSKTPP